VELDHISLRRPKDSVDAAGRPIAGVGNKIIGNATIVDHCSDFGACSLISRHLAACFTAVAAWNFGNRSTAVPSAKHLRAIPSAPPPVRRSWRPRRSFHNSMHQHHASEFIRLLLLIDQQ
jgi:hypothetical protein